MRANISSRAGEVKKMIKTGSSESAGTAKNVAVYKEITDNSSDIGCEKLILKDA
jgi:hypothetical protein